MAERQWVRRPPRLAAAGRPPWLKPAFAVGAVVAVVVAGVFTLNRMQEAVITPTNSVTSPGHQHGAGCRRRAGQPGPVAAADRRQSECSARHIQEEAPARGACGSLHPDAHAQRDADAERQRVGQRDAHAERQRSASPTPTPSDTGSPTDTPTTGTGGGTATGSGSVTKTTADAKFTPDIGGGTPDVTCGSTPKTKATTNTSS